MQERLNDGKITRIIEIGPESAVPEHGCLVFEKNDVEIVVVRQGGRYHAIDRYCPHAGEDLSRGRLENENRYLVCPRHEGTFDVTDGTFVDNGYVSPQLKKAMKNTRHYNVEVKGGRLFVEVP